jgi:hypothetical protein
MEFAKPGYPEERLYNLTLAIRDGLLAERQQPQGSITLIYSFELLREAAKKTGDSKTEEEANALVEYLYKSQQP